MMPATGLTTTFLLALFVFFSINSAGAENRRRQSILEKLLNGSGLVYDARVPPNYEDDYPTDVSVQVYVLSFDSLTEIAMEYSLTIFLRQNWTDRRLAWNDSSLAGPLEVDPKLMTRVWEPDLYFLNEKEAIVHDVTVMNKLMHIHKDGTIHTSVRISMTLSCDMHLERYPHDEQTCSLYAGSYSYSSENVVLRWHNAPLQMRPTMTLPRFTVKNNKTKLCGPFDFGKHSIIRAGNFSCIQADFYLRRQFGYYIAQVYIPSVLIVVLSWVSFWIDIDAIPARVSLGLLTVLAITTQSTGEKSALPRVSYVKAIDVWMAVCLMFVFMALLEFSYVNVQCRVQKRRQGTIFVETTEGAADRNGKDLPNMRIEARSKRRFVFFRDRLKLQRARFVDKCSRVIFPALFFVFNISYWLYYRQD